MSKARFNLEVAIATWRRFLLSERSISADDADELESHLRDEIEEAGLTPDAAFRQAVRRLGDYALLERSYRRVYWKKLREEHRITNELQWRLSMLKNYLKIALRNLRKHRGYAFINVTGLAVGIACCVLIMLFVHDELSYDRHHEQADQIYRLALDMDLSDGVLRLARSSPPMASALLDAFPEIIEAVRLQSMGTLLVSQENHRFYEERFYFAEANVFEVFTMPLLWGNPQTALQRPFSVVLTEKAARSMRQARTRC